MLAVALPVIVVGSTSGCDCPFPRTIGLSHGVEGGVGVLLPDEFDVALRDLPDERLVRGAEVERVELPPHSAVWRHIACAPSSAAISSRQFSATARRAENGHLRVIWRY